MSRRLKIFIAISSVFFIVFRRDLVLGFGDYIYDVIYVVFPSIKMLGAS